MSDDMKARPLERHAQTAIQVFLIAICSWMALTVHQSSLALGVLTERVATLQTQVDRSNTDFSDEMKDLRERVRELERKAP